MKPQLTAAEAGRELGFTRNMIRHWCRAGWLAPAGEEGRRFLYNREDLLRANATAKEAVTKSALAKLEKAWEARAELQGAVRGVKKVTPRPNRDGKLQAKGYRSLSDRYAPVRVRPSSTGEAMYQPKPKVLKIERVESSTEALKLGRELRALARMMR